MHRKARRYLAFMALTFLVAAGIARAQEDTSVPAGGHKVTGRVMDAEGRPLAGVEIWGRAEGPPVAVSGPDGMFTSNLLPFASLTACPPGWLYEEIRFFPQSKRPFEFRLQPAARLSGRVVDGRGEPVPGVQVAARFAGWFFGCIISSPPKPCPGNSRLRSGSTDADGRFVMESLELGWFEVGAWGDSPEVVRWQGVAGGNSREVEIVLSGKLVPLEGRVMDADGKPVPGAKVSVSGARPAIEEQTDETGSFRFPSVLSGPQDLYVSHPDLGQLEQEIRVEESPARLDVRMLPLSMVQMRILGRDGSSVTEPRLLVDWASVKPDPEGQFRFNLSKGEHVVRVDAANWVPEERLVTATGDPIELNIELSRPATVTGRITGLPPGERATLELAEGPQEDYGTDAKEDGRFHYYSVAPGTWTLVASDDNRRTLKRRIQVEEGREITVEDLQFPPLPSIRGRVLDPEGRAVPNAELTFHQGELMVGADADAEGRFTAHLVDGTWTVEAEAQGLGSAATTVTVADAPAEVPDLRLVRLVAVSGYVRGLAPGEAVGAVRATSEDGLWLRGGRADQENYFQIPDLWQGTWILTAGIGERETSTLVRILPGDTAVRADMSFAQD